MSKFKPGDFVRLKDPDGLNIAIWKGEEEMTIIKSCDNCIAIFLHKGSHVLKFPDVHLNYHTILFEGQIYDILINHVVSLEDD